MSLEALLNKVATQGKDQSQASAGGGDFAPAEKGTTGARLVGYYEVGQFEEEWEGKKKKVNKAITVWELVGKKHPPRELDDGTKIPVRITMEVSISDYQNSGFYKLFSKLRTEETHFSQLLGKAFLLDIVHKEREKGGKKVVYANIDRNSIRKPVLLERADLADPESELIEKPYPVGAALTPINAFIWEFADAERWDAIRIDGEYPARVNDKGEETAPARSKNTIQLKIASALNFKGLPCYDYAASRLAGDGKVTAEDTANLAAAVGDVENAAQPDPEDPMAGIG